MRQLKHLIFLTLMCLCCTLQALAGYSGSPSEPSQITAENYTDYGFTASNYSAFVGYYAISSAEELYGFAELVNGGTTDANGVLTADIVVNEYVLNDDGTLSGTPTYSWTPIGTNSKKYAGIFDGNGHTISGLYFNNATNDNYPDGGRLVGLIGYANGATIKNVGVVDSYIKGYGYVGGICGMGGTINNSYNTGTITGSEYVGGICGGGGTITNSYNTGKISSISNLGGICGYYGNITNCYNTGAVSGRSYVGGICGYSGTQTSCYNTGMVSGSSYVGGICGKIGTQTNCYYLTGSCSSGGGGGSFAAGDVASGRLTYLLNGSTSEGELVCYQTIGTDAQPVWDNTHGVVYASQPCASVFSNENNEARQEHSSMDATGHCTACGQYIAQGATKVTESNYDSLNLTADFIDYYAISNSADLYWFADLVNSSNTNREAKAVLTADIVVNEYVLNADGTLNGTPTYSWTPIGTYSKNYKGTFDGNGHTISGLYFNNATDGNYPNGGDYVGLIGYGQAVTIKNVGVIDSYLKGRQYVGGICGCSNYQSTIINCYNTGTISGTSDFIGGICGAYGTQTNCYNTGMVSTPHNVGGICGLNGTQNNCYNLEGCCRSNGGGVSATAEEFESGKITYLLNGSTSEGDLAWYQTLGDVGDAYPVLDNTHGVVYTTQPCVSFGNISGVTVDHVFENGRCTVCGECVCIDGVYQLANADHLYWFAGQVNGGRNTINAILTDNIVVNENVLTAEGELNGDGTNFETWTPIGTSTYKYAGTFDGNGHTISGLYFSKTASNNYPSGGNNVGLIGYCRGATIKNVGLIDSYIKGYTCVGGICGYASNPTITNCYNTATVLGSYDVGGICGEGVGLSQEKCHNSGKISGIRFVGGICGYSNYNSSTNCYNTGMVSCSDYSVGGICGYGDGSQINCYNTGTVSGNSNVGGICGSGCTQYNCYYLESCGSMNALGISVTAEELASGKITYLLNGSTSEGDFAWYQTLGDDGDACPVLDNTHAVVYTTQPCTSEFSNTEGDVKNHPSMNTIGHCTACDLLITQEATLVTESNYSSFNLTADFIDYYTISNASDLYWFADLVNNSKPTANAVLTADIVVNENVLNEDGTLNGTPTYSWTPIGIKGSYFEGTFDGNGHTISGLYFNSTINADYPAGGNTVGLIGQANESTIKNVGVIDSYIRGFYNVGSICGGGWHATITNCHNSGTVTGTSSVGGICGEYGIITNCHNEGLVSGTYVGGIVGTNGTVSNCYNTGRISGYYRAGGIGCDNVTISNCYNTGTVSSSSSSGAICNVNGTVTNSYYLAGSCSSSGGGVYVTVEEFANGKIGYLLNKDNNNAWYQDLYSDDYPLLDNTHNLVSGYIEAADDTYTVVGDMYLATNYEVAAGKTLIVPANATITTTGNAVITNNGTLHANGTVAGNNLAGNGSFIYDQLAATDIVFNKESYTYKGTAFTLADGLDVTISRVMCGKTFTFDDSKTSVSYENNRNVGDNAKVTWGNTNGSSVSKTFSITPKTLAISNIAAEPKTYDGNTVTTVSYTADVFSGDDVTFGAAAAFADKNVGTSKTVSFSYTKSGADAGNYVFANESGETTADIDQRQLEFSSITAAGKVYDGNTTTTVTIVASNIVEGDVVVFGTAAAFDNKNVGTDKDVNFDFTKSGADADNYKFTAATGTVKANITARELALSNFAADNKVYDGTVEASGSFSDDRVNGDVLEFSYTVEFDNANVVENGNSVSFSNIAISGGTDKDNYSLVTFTGSAAANITPKEISLTWSNTSLVYNGAEQIATAAIGGLIGEDACTVTVEGTAKNVGTYTAMASALSNANYKLPEAASSEFTIAAKEVSLAWSNTALVYNGAEQIATATAEGLIGEDTCTVTVEGAAKNVGNHTATASVLSNANYKLSAAVTSQFSIAAKEVGLAWSNTALVYNGAEQIATATAEGLETGDECAVTVEGAKKDAGNYTATASALSNANYKLPAAVTSSFTIEPKEVSLAWSDTALTYNGKNQVATAMAGGLIGEDACTVTVEGAAMNVGTYTATASALSNANYKLPEAVESAFTIASKTGVVVTITENSGELVYNTKEQTVSGYTFGINDELGIYAESDFAFSGNATVSGTTVGEYAMELSAADFSNLNTNYADVEFVVVDGKLTITKAAEAPNKPAATIETRYVNTQLVELPADWRWNGDRNLDLGTNKDTAIYVGADAGNYNIERAVVTITRLACLHNSGDSILYVLEPTCSHAGYTGNHSCKLCGEIYEYGDSIPALGHAYDTVVVAPTCTAVGYTQLTCSRCGEVVNTDTVPALGHTPDSIVIENVVAATYTTAGSYDSVVYCSRCGEELSRTHVEVPMLIAAAQKIELKSMPKVEYVAGEKLDVSGAVVVVTFSNGTTKEIALSAAMVSGFDAKKVGEQKLTVTYTVDGVTLTTTFTVKVEKNTAVDDEAVAEVSIYAINRTIVVETAEPAAGYIFVFDANGRLVAKELATSNRTEIAMTRQGLYIVRIGDKAERVVVY